MSYSQKYAHKNKCLFSQLTVGDPGWHCTKYRNINECLRRDYDCMSIQVLDTPACHLIMRLDKWHRRRNGHLYTTITGVCPSDSHWWYLTFCNGIYWFSVDFISGVKCVSIYISWKWPFIDHHKLFDRVAHPDVYANTLLIVNGSGDVLVKYLLSWCWYILVVRWERCTGISQIDFQFLGDAWFVQWCMGMHVCWGDNYMPGRKVIWGATSLGHTCPSVTLPPCPITTSTNVPLSPIFIFTFYQAEHHNNLVLVVSGEGLFGLLG